MTEEKSAAEIQKDIADIREWIAKQPHFPQNLEDKMLRRFLHSCYYSLEKTKKCLEMFFTVRAACPEILSNRDPTSPEMKTVYSIMNLATIRLKDNSNLFIWQLNDPGLEKFDYLNDAKMALSQTDVWILEEDFLGTRDIAIMDMKDISLKILTKLNVSIAKKMGQYQQEALPVRLKEIHLINCPSVIDKIFGIMKNFVSQEICDMVHFHTPNSDTLYKYINRDELPEDFGGKAGKMEDHTRAWLKRIENQRKFLMNEKLWVADESKRPKDNKISQSGLQNGSFRKLDLD